MLFMADNRLAYLFTPQSLISYITLSASAYCLFSEDVELIDTYELKAMKVLRVLSISRIEEVLKRKNMPLGTAVFRLVFESVALIMIFASAMLRTENRWYLMPQIVEAKAADPDWEENSSLYLYRFHDLIYYTVISITTTGYGDISPQTKAGQVFFIIFFIALLVVLPGRVTELQKMSSLTSTFGSFKYKGDPDKQHFLLLGDSSFTAIETFLSECFHSDHGKINTEIVILRDCEPDE